jgi:ATP-dependent Clp protease ATP-binding subunit ClpC
MYTLADSIKDYRPAIALAHYLPRHRLSQLRTGSFFFTLLAGGAALGLPFTPYEAYSPLALGLACISGALWLDQLLAYSYHNSYYFYGLSSIIDSEHERVGGATYDVAAALYRSEGDIAYGFCTAPLGLEVLLRCGLTQEDIAAYLEAPRQKISAASVPLPPEEIFTLIGLGKYLHQHDTAFAQLFTTHGIKADDFLATLRWIIGTHHQLKRRERWWGKDNLARNPGIGGELAYGTAYLLQQYARDIRTTAVFSTLSYNPPLAQEKIIEIEQTLARAKTANVLIIGEAGVGKMDLLMAVQKRLAQGQSLNAINGQHFVVLDTNRLFAVHADKQSLEIALLQIFDQAAAAGNTIIVIENLSSVLRQAEAIGVFLPELLDEYLATPNLHVVATDTPGAYHRYLEPLGAFTRRFTEILIDKPDLSATIRVLESVALAQEQRYNCLFTYPGLSAIATAADRYIVEGVMPDKAIELLVDVATRASEQQLRIITADVVYTVVSQKTGIPTGPIQDTERETLLHLEDALHRQVIGQQPALDAIARTMRRARAGIQAADKPIGSFLFLGPTGVGKTETAKALATIFFGGAEKLERLDMSEFSGPDALERLIGANDQAGLLADMLREHPYCVLLLDEFEKAHRDVHDLFLQILDEGVFTDARGATVNARNTIIIATSNAGSALILKTVAQRQSLQHLTAEIINHIITSGIYRPELINRFDSTIIFEPLTPEEQGQVATLLLKQLHDRIEDRGFQLEIQPDVITFLITHGYSAEFGARPMQRLIQDVLEEAVAQKIISGAVQVGETITLAARDLTPPTA